MKTLTAAILMAFLIIGGMVALGALVKVLFNLFMLGWSLIP